MNKKTNTEKKYVLNIYNTCTGRNEEVEVTREVFKAFKRSYWKEKNSDRSLYKHTYSISALEGADSQEDSFCEFAVDDLFPEYIADKDLCDRLLSCLSETAKRRVELYYFNGLNMSEIAEIEGVSFQKISTSIKGALKKMKKIYFQG